MEEDNLLVLKMTVREAQGSASISNHRVVNHAIGTKFIDSIVECDRSC